MSATGARDHLDAMRREHKRVLWSPWAIVILGAWLASSPFIATYRSQALLWNDVLAGVALVALGLRSLNADAVYARWAACAIGLWLLVAPLAFWAPTAFEYNNATLVGALVIAFSVLVPGMPSRRHHAAMMKPGPDVPPGWTYNPSSWLQRGPMIALAILSFLIARHLAAYQLGHVDFAWDPFFGGQTARVLESDVSRAWPVSDAGLGAVAYMIEALSGLMGNEQRWRNMPWMSGLFGLMVVPLGAVSIILVLLQPIAVSAWCALCLITALLMLLMIPLAVDEVVATGQFLLAARREGQSLWSVFWFGGTLRGEGAAPRTRRHGPTTRSRAAAALWGVTMPLGLLASGLLGMALLLVPDLLGVGRPAAIHVWLAGTLIAVVSATAFSELARPFRFLNLPLALWLVGIAWLIPSVPPLAAWTLTAASLIVILTSLPRGAIREAYGPSTAFARWRPHEALLHRAARRRGGPEV